LAITDTVARVAGVVVDAEFPSGDLDAGTLQVNGEGVTVFAGSQTSEVCETSEVLEDDRHFDRLTQDLLAKLNAQPEGVSNTEQRAEENRT
jgi:hypothetical protein